MKRFFNNLIVAFAMYSKIPMPRADWSEDNMKYAMCFFPWVGFVIGGLQYGWFLLALWLNVGVVLRTALFILIPVLITGGIHFDGFLDTSDAMSSWREPKQRLAILKDSHTGAFALICGITYFVLDFGLASEMSRDFLGVYCLAGGVSRCFSALSVVHFPHANPNGTAAAFGDRSERKTVTLTMIIYLIVLTAFGIWMNPLYGVLLIGISGLVFWYYHHMAMKYFGGMTGDLAGFFVSVCEISVLAGMTAVSVIVRAVGSL